MFNIGFTEFLVIGVVALLVIGPKQLPEVARVVGRLISELKKATQDLSGGLLEVTKEVKDTIEDTRDDLIREGQDIMDAANPLKHEDFHEKSEEQHDHHHEEPHQEKIEASDHEPMKSDDEPK